MTEEEAREILGASPDDDQEKIKKLYRRKAMDTHPDTNFTDTKEVATAKMQKINEAKEFLDKKFEGNETSRVTEESYDDAQNRKESEEQSRRNAESARRQREEDERRRAQQNEWDKAKNRVHETTEERAEWEDIKQTARAEREQRRDKESELNKGVKYGKIPTIYRHESFSHAINRKNGHYSPFFDRLYPEFKKAIPTNIALQEYLKLIRERAKQIHEEEFVQALINRANNLAILYVVVERKTPEYFSEIRKSFILVLAILNKVKTLDGLDEELELVRSEVSSEAGSYLWNELKQLGDMNYRMNVVRSILSGRTMESIVELYKEKGREALKELIKSNVVEVDFGENQESYVHAA